LKKQGESRLPALIIELAEVFDMGAVPIFVHCLARANRIPLERCGGADGYSLGPLEKPIAKRTVTLKSDVTSSGDCLFRRCLVRSDQERKAMQKISLIPEAGHDFGC